MAITQAKPYMTKPVSSPDEALLAQLWSRFRTGDEAAFDQLVRLRYRVLFNYATRFTKDRDFIKDCLQDLFLELWNRRQHIVETPYVTIYLIKALRNNLFRKLKLAQRSGDSTDDIDFANELTDGHTVEKTWIEHELLNEKEQHVRQAIEQLPKRQQEVVFLKFYEGLSNEDISQVMNVERQTVANFLYRALTQLKTNLSFLIVCLLFLLGATI